MISPDTITSAAPAASPRAKPSLPSKVKTQAAPASKPAARAAAPRRRQGNKRSEATITGILEAADRVILESGAERISILDVCVAAGISRGTFYRYFASQEELIDAISRHKREIFHVLLAQEVGPCTDPDKRFETLIAHLDGYLETCNSRRLLLVAPEFALKFFKSIFHDSVIRFQDLLAPVFDAWDQRLGGRLDRELICELIIRFTLSEHLVDSASDRKSMPRRIGRMIDALRFGGVARTRR